MSFIALHGGYYKSNSLIAAAQRCLNLYPENVPSDTGEPFNTIDLCTPGLTRVAIAPQDTCRCLYTASNGELWACYGHLILWYSSAGLWTIVGGLYPSSPTDATWLVNPVSMTDNGTTLLIADGSLDGWTANVITHDGFARINPTTAGYEGWYGADIVSFQDTFFIANKPTSPIFYTSGSEAATFDPLDFASMTGQATYLKAAVSMHRNLWLLGNNSYEIWINNGGTGTAAGSFPFSIYPEAFGNFGCAAVHSVATISNHVFFLSQDKYGRGIVMMGAKLEAGRISTHAIEQAIADYPVISDAIGMCYQSTGHQFYMLTFPSAREGRGATWVFDLASKLWHERAYINDDGIEFRHHANAISAAYGKVFVGDWRNGNLYTFDANNYTDDGQPIKRVRTFPHQIDLEANRRVMYHQLIAQMQVGSASQIGPAQTIIDCDFVAADGTLLQNYTNINALGLPFTKIDAVNAVIINDAVVAETAGEVLYLVAGTPTTPDYTIRYRVEPSSYVSVALENSIIAVIGRANASNLGYKASIFANETGYTASLEPMGYTISSVILGTIASGYYELVLTMRAEAISLAIYRSEDGFWIDATGTWVGSPATAIYITDTHYTESGRILINEADPAANVDIPLSGVSETGQTGTLSVDVPLDLALSGVSASGGVGSLAGSTAPAPALAAGFTNLVFEDDFTDATTIAPDASPAAGYNWYWSNAVDGTCYTVLETDTAATISNGNTGGGSNASPAGGILQLPTAISVTPGVSAQNASLITVPGWQLVSVPSEGDGCWQHAYFEAYMQFRINGATDPDWTASGWPAFWTWSVQALNEYGFGGSPITTAAWAEVDIMETYDTFFGHTAGDVTGTAIQWPAHSVDFVSTTTNDEWHTWGCLWKQTGAVTGQLNFYKDNVAIGSAILTGTGHTQVSLESMYQFLILGTGVGWETNVDWVRVWQ